MASVDSPVLPDTYSSSKYQENEEFTALEYARLNGLSRNHLSDSLAATHIELLQGLLEDPPMDSSLLPPFSFGVEPRLDERLILSKDAARLLSNITQAQSTADISSVGEAILSSIKGRNMKVELPLLKSDHETDCKNLAKWEGFEIQLQDIKLPLEVVDEEKNQGPNFPARYWHLGSGVIEGLKEEKFVVSRDTLNLLSETLQNTWTEEDDIELWRHECNYMRVSDTEHNCLSLGSPFQSLPLTKTTFV